MTEMCMLFQLRILIQKFRKTTFRILEKVSLYHMLSMETVNSPRGREVVFVLLLSVSLYGPKNWLCSTVNVAVLRVTTTQKNKVIR